MTTGQIHTILVVDDDKEIVQGIQGNLELDGYPVICDHDGRSGIEMTRERRPHLIVTVAGVGYKYEAAETPDRVLAQNPKGEGNLAGSLDTEYTSA